MKYIDSTVEPYPTTADNPPSMFYTVYVSDVQLD